MVNTTCLWKQGFKNFYQPFPLRKIKPNPTKPNTNKKMLGFNVSLLIKDKLLPGLLEWPPPQSPLYQCFHPGSCAEQKGQLLCCFYVPFNHCI